MIANKTDIVLWFMRGTTNGIVKPVILTTYVCAFFVHIEVEIISDCEAIISWTRSNSAFGLRLP